MLLCLAVAQVGAGSSAISAPMTFRMAPDAGVHLFYRETLGSGRHRIYASGEIEAQTAAKLKSFVELRRVESAVVIFDSSGGSLLGGIRLGEAIRRMEFDTSVATGSSDFESEKPAVCASACAYAFAGGLSRYLPKGSALGVHQFYGVGDNLGDRGETQAVSAALVEYLTRMGVDSSAFVVASKAPSTGMTWLGSARATSLGLVNDGALPTTAEIKLADDMTPYLRLEQVRSNGTARVLMVCGTSGIMLSGGVVTEPELSLRRERAAERSYFEADGFELFSLPGQQGVTARDSTLWWDRAIPFEAGSVIAASKELAMWIENGTDLRWGMEVDLKPVAAQVGSFVANCRRKNGR